MKPHTLTFEIVDSDDLQTCRLLMWSDRPLTEKDYENPTDAMKLANEFLRIANANMIDLDQESHTE